MCTKQECEYLIPIKKKSTKLPEYPFKKGDIIGSFIVAENDYVYHHKRYQVQLTCQCGGIKYQRPNRLFQEKCMWCAKCRGYNIYPERRDQSNHFENGIHVTWLTSTNANLERGSRILESEITLLDLKELYDEQNGKCIYTGIELNILGLKKIESNASIDRRDSKLGYTKENTQWVYKPLNIMKNSFSEEEFIFVCKKVANFI
jgi:hypothetical protein